MHEKIEIKCDYNIINWMRSSASTNRDKKRLPDDNSNNPAHESYSQAQSIEVRQIVGWRLVGMRALTHCFTRPGSAVVPSGNIPGSSL